MSIVYVGVPLVGVWGWMDAEISCKLKAGLFVLNRRVNLPKLGVIFL